MTSGDSVFSCIKQQEIPEEAARHTPQYSPAPPPPPQLKQQEDLCAKIAALEGKIKKLEERDAITSALIEGFKAEVKTAQRRADELERNASGWQKTIETLSAAMGQFKEETSALRMRTGSVEETLRRFDLSNSSSISLSVALLEGRLKNLEAGLANELKERFLTLDAAFRETSGKAGLAQETAMGSARRVEKLEERAARLPYLENRLNSYEGKLERLYDLDALSQSLKSSVEGMENNFNTSMHESASLSGEHKKICSDFESLSRQVKHFAALFNQLRTELSFLMPKKQESFGD